MPRSSFIYHSSPDYPVLTGREVCRDILCTRLIDAWGAGQRVVGLYGPGGIGKTTLSVQVAAALGGAAARPDALLSVERVLWIELRICPNSGGVLSQIADCVHEMGFTDLARQIRSAARPALPPLALALTQALGPHCLLIVDQCETVLDADGRVADPYLQELLAVVLNQTGWRGLLMVRTATNGNAPASDLLAPEINAITWFPVDELSADERTALLYQALPNSPLRWDILNVATQQRILNDIAGHPYVFNLFLAEPGADPAATVTEIRSLGAADDSILYAALDYYVAKVPLTARSMLELLAALEDREPWPFLDGAWQTLGNILGWPLRRASAALSDLTRRALVEEGAGGYRLVPIVRRYLSERPAPLGQAPGLARLFHFHLTRLYEVLAKQVKEQAQNLLASEDNAAAQRAAELIRYHAVLRDRTLRQAFYRGNLRLIRLALENLVESTPWPLTERLTAGRCLAYIHQLNLLVTATINRLDDPDAQPAEVGACYHAIGRVCTEINAQEPAQAAYQSALLWWERTQQPHRLGDTWLHLGRFHAKQQQWPQALHAYGTALDWWERTRQYSRMGQTWYRMGRLHAAQENWSEALDAYRTALDWQGRTNRHGESSGTWRRMGEVHEAQGQPGAAALAYAQALELLFTYDVGAQRGVAALLAAARRLLASSSPEIGAEWERLRKIVAAWQNN